MRKFIIIALLVLPLTAGAGIFDWFNLFSVKETVIVNEEELGGFPVFFPSGTGPQYVITISNGCAEWASNILTTTGSACGSGGGGDPNVIINTVGGTTYLQASTTVNAWLFNTGFVSQASSTIDADLTITGNSTTTNATSSPFSIFS